MRIWHKDLIQHLPQQQLVAQWRELSAIVGSIQKNETPNHRLVNKILDYPTDHLGSYAKLIDNEMVKRGYKVSQLVRDKIYNYCGHGNDISFGNLYSGWHTDRYLRQCLINLQEKYDCFGIPDIEWQLIKHNFKCLFDFEL